MPPACVYVAVPVALGVAAARICVAMEALIFNRKSADVLCHFTVFLPLAELTPLCRVVIFFSCESSFCCNPFQGD